MPYRDNSDIFSLSKNQAISAAVTQVVVVGLLYFVVGNRQLAIFSAVAFSGLGAFLVLRHYILQKWKSGHPE